MCVHYVAANIGAGRMHVLPVAESAHCAARQGHAISCSCMAAEALKLDPRLHYLLLLLFSSSVEPTARTVYCTVSVAL